MTRLTTAIPAFALGVAAVALTAGCSAGQISQTSSQVAAVPGANRDIELKDSHDLLVGRVSLRDVMVQYSEKGYPKDGTAPLQIRIINDSPFAVKLCAVTSESGTVAKASGGIVPPSAAATPSNSASAAPTAGASASASASAAPTASAVASPSASAAPVAAGGCELNITVPGQGYTQLLPGQLTYLQLTKLTDELKPGVVARGFTFTFQDSKGKSVTSDKFEIPMGIPLTPGPRTSPELGGEHK
ncbi:hypothetical protein Lfu02_30610 [Longispora fulva]|uniref:Lipoprotein LpqE n=1 Tax=Longispora fulva TaxID=619741 RepID=A0A8J7GJC8_9ACTN|nr:hypothetical protein [Longispora fulva]MBG6139196.1 hypothetical protein [Longispora fulva]GIG58689.1 hypothetical protein Lfu02_30610 [Longispora fulva]